MPTSPKLIRRPKDALDLAIFAYVVVRSIQGLHYLGKDIMDFVVERRNAKK